MNFTHYSNPLTFRSGSDDPIVIEEGAINLDDITDEDLISFWTVAESYPRQVAKAMFPDKKKAYTTVRQLALYAKYGISARGFRSMGKIEKAMKLEKINEALYRNLPEYARW